MKDDSFFDRVYAVVRQVPHGKVTSYGAIARYLGAARSARMVGWAMNASHGQPGIPAHRVLNRTGLLTGKQHFGHPNLMQHLLENEGHQIEDNQILHLDRVFWDPNRELPPLEQTFQ